MLADVCGISLIGVAQRYVRHNPLRFALGVVMLELVVMSFLPRHTIPNRPMSFLLFCTQVF
jgi:hypothetical protein